MNIFSRNEQFSTWKIDPTLSGLYGHIINFDIIEEFDDRRHG